MPQIGGGGAPRSSFPTTSPHPLTPSQTLPVSSEAPKMSTSVTSSTFKLLCKRKPMCSFSPECLLLHLTLEYLPKDFVTLSQMKGIWAQQTLQEECGQARCFLRSPEDSHLQPVTHIHMQALIVYVAFFSVLTNLNINCKRKWKKTYIKARHW